jgi:tRNA(Ile)-lysidine synthase
MPSLSRKSPNPEDRVFRFIRENGLTVPGELILVGVSGGPDSVCLLSLLNALKHELGIRLHVAHLNHQFRGAEAQADADYVAGLAAKLGIPATIESRDVALYRKEKHLSLEEAARDVRYAFFSNLAAKLATDKVAVGHTAEDHVETILLHLIRGSGTRGLAGLSPVTLLRPGGRPLRVIRPILLLSHAETRVYCQTNGLGWRTDRSNLLPETTRNRIRLELLPLLHEYNPEIAQALVRLAMVIGDDMVFIDRTTQNIWPEIVNQSENLVTFDKTRFLALPVSLQRNLLRQVIASLTGGLNNIELIHIEDMMSVIKKGAGKRIILPGGLVLATGYREFSLKTSAAPTAQTAPIEGSYPLKIPGKTHIPGWQIESWITEGNLAGIPALAEAKLTAYLDFDRTGDDLTVRSKKSGDRFIPLGMKALKTVSEFLIDAKIPREARACIPVVASHNQIIWLAGLRIGESVKVTESTRRVLRIEFTRREPLTSPIVNGS